jgi:hypothetical protein
MGRRRTLARAHEIAGELEAMGREVRLKHTRRGWSIYYKMRS